MLLYIIRHAHAGQHGDPRYPDDALRPLTKKGRKQFSRLVKRLSRRGFAPQLVATSPLVRCRQTAQVLVERLEEAPKLLELAELAPGSELGRLIAWTDEQPYERVAWVGHAPDVDRMIAGLISRGDAQVVCGKGAVAEISFPDRVMAGEGTLQFLVTPKSFG